MSKKDIYNLISLCMSLGATYNDYENLIIDEKVNDCLSDVYFSMLCKEKKKSEYFYNSFEKKYKELDEEQQEIVKEQIAKILDIEYKPKIKKKER